MIHSNSLYGMSAYIVCTLLLIGQSHCGGQYQHSKDLPADSSNTDQMGIQDAIRSYMTGAPIFGISRVGMGPYIPQTQHIFHPFRTDTMAFHPVQYSQGIQHPGNLSVALSSMPVSHPLAFPTGMSTAETQSTGSRREETTESSTTESSTTESSTAFQLNPNAQPFVFNSQPQQYRMPPGYYSLEEDFRSVPEEEESSNFRPYYDHGAVFYQPVQSFTRASFTFAGEQRPFSHPASQHKKRDSAPQELFNSDLEPSTPESQMTSPTSRTDDPLGSDDAESQPNTPPMGSPRNAGNTDSVETIWSESMFIGERENEEDEQKDEDQLLTAMLQKMEVQKRHWETESVVLEDIAPPVPEPAKKTMSSDEQMKFSLLSSKILSELRSPQYFVYDDSFKDTKTPSQELLEAIAFGVAKGNLTSTDAITRQMTESAPDGVKLWNALQESDIKTHKMEIANFINNSLNNLTKFEKELKDTKIYYDFRHLIKGSDMVLENLIQLQYSNYLRRQFQIYFALQCEEQYEIRLLRIPGKNTRDKFDKLMMAIYIYLSRGVFVFDDDHQFSYNKTPFLLFDHIVEFLGSLNGELIKEIDDEYSKNLMKPLPDSTKIESLGENLVHLIDSIQSVLLASQVDDDKTWNFFPEVQESLTSEVIKLTQANTEMKDGILFTIVAQGKLSFLAYIFSLLYENIFASPCRPAPEPLPTYIEPNISAIHKLHFNNVTKFLCSNLDHRNLEIRNLELHLENLYLNQMRSHPFIRAMSLMMSKLDEMIVKKYRTFHEMIVRDNDAGLYENSSQHVKLMIQQIVACKPSNEYPSSIESGPIAIMFTYLDTRRGPPGNCTSAMEDKATAVPSMGDESNDFCLSNIEIGNTVAVYRGCDHLVYANAKEIINDPFVVKNGTKEKNNLSALLPVSRYDIAKKCKHMEDYVRHFLPLDLVNRHMPLPH